MGSSNICSDPRTHYDRITGVCVACPSPRAGHELIPHCGFDDSGSKHSSSFRECANGTFNEGSSDRCRPCSSCQPPLFVRSACNSTTDTRCEEESRFRSLMTEPPVTSEAHLFPLVSDVGAVAAALFVTLALLCVVVICVKRRRGQQAAVVTFRKRSSLAKEGFTQFADELDNVLSPDILSAPLQTVLDNLDTLEELIILLDPDSQKAKCTKHLASHWSFPSTWITYAYSMRDSNSPLRAVLEGVTCRHPDWTVGHLAKMLRQMERNDAVTVLAKLRPDKTLE